MMQTACPTLSKSIPKIFEQAFSGPDKEKWIEVLHEEFTALTKMNTWTLVKLPQGRRVVRFKWVFDIKTDSMGDIEQYRARIVAMGLFQKEGIDFFDVFAPVVKYLTVRLFFCITTRHDWKCFSIDIKCAFINSDLAEEIYVVQPEGFIREGLEDHVYPLKKAIYGLSKQTKPGMTCCTRS